MDYQKIVYLAENVGNLQYDLTGKVIDDIAERFAEEAKNNPEKAPNYISAVISLKEAKNSINEAWRICEKYMKKGSVHPRKVPGYKISNIASKIFNDGSEKIFLCELAGDLWSQAYCDDTVRNRKKLAPHLYAASEKLDEAAEFIHKTY